MYDGGHPLSEGKQVMVHEILLQEEKPSNETSDEDGPATLVGYFRGFGRPASMDTGRQACSEVCSVFES